MAFYSLITGTGDPCFNLAAEEYLLQAKRDDFIIISVNDPSVIVGKHQVVHREVNVRYTGELGIPVIRRISGGGTVWHDHGNLNFAFIRNSSEGKQVDFRLYTQPVIEFLRHIGITAVFEGKNDLTVDGFKISGNAEHVFRERVLHHGTLLFNASIGKMSRALKARNNNYSSRGVESNRSRVANLSERLPDIRDAEHLGREMQLFFRSYFGIVEEYNLSGEEKDIISGSAISKYGSWEWNYGYGPPYTFESGITLSGRDYRLKLEVKDGIIWQCDITGDDGFHPVGKMLIGTRHMHGDIMRIFESEKMPLTADEADRFF